MGLQTADAERPWVYLEKQLASVGAGRGWSETSLVTTLYPLMQHIGDAAQRLLDML